MSNFLRTVAVTPTIGTSSIASGDVFADTTEIVGSCLAKDQPTYLVGCNVIDYGDNTAADIQLVVLAGSTSLGTASSAPNIADTTEIIGYITIASADWKDVGGFKINRVDPAKLPLPCHPKSGTASIYFGLIAGGSMTVSQGDIKMRFYFQDTYPW